MVYSNSGAGIQSKFHFKCKDCSYETNDQKECMNHINSHNIRKPKGRLKGGPKGRRKVLGITRDQYVPTMKALRNAIESGNYVKTFEEEFGFFGIFCIEIKFYVIFNYFCSHS